MAIVDLYPTSLRLLGRPVLVVGGGTVAARRAKALLDLYGYLDRDRDGIPDRFDRDRDGDGVNDTVDDAQDLLQGYRGVDGFQARGLKQLGYSIKMDAAKQPARHADATLFLLPGGEHKQSSWGKMLVPFLLWAYGGHRLVVAGQVPPPARRERSAGGCAGWPEDQELTPPSPPLQSRGGSRAKGELLALRSAGIADAAEFGVLAPVRPLVGVRQVVADAVEQLQVARHAGE